MKIISPLIYSAADIASNIPIPDPVPDSSATVWAIGTTYADKAIVYKGILLYESLAGENVGNDPVTTNNEVSETPNWLLLGAVNRHRMFDGKVGSYSVGVKAVPADPISVTNPSVINTTITFHNAVDYVAFFGLSASYMEIEVNDSVQDWTFTHELYYDPLIDMQEFFFAPLVQPTKDVTFKIVDDSFGLLALSGTLNVKITNEVSEAQCGLCLIGRGVEIGTARYGINTGIMSFSRKERDQWGRVFLRKGASAKRLNVSLFLEAGGYSRVQQILTHFDGQAVVWDANSQWSDQSSFVVYGFTREFRLVLDTPTFAECSLDIEGLI